MCKQVLYFILLAWTSNALAEGFSLFQFLGNNGQISGRRQPPRTNYCTDLTQPCDYAMRESAGALHSTASASCTCQNMACPNSWEDDSGRSVNTDIVMIDGSRMTIQLRYCTEVSANRDCSGDEVSLTMSGYGPVAMFVEKSHCLCPGGVSARLQTTWLERHKTMYNYTCSKPTCESTTENTSNAPVCREQVTGYVNGIFKRQTFYLCDCPSTTQCLLQESRETGIDEINTISLWKCVA